MVFLDPAVRRCPLSLRRRARRWAAQARKAECEEEDEALNEGAGVDERAGEEDAEAGALVLLPGLDREEVVESVDRRARAFLRDLTQAPGRVRLEGCRRVVEEREVEGEEEEEEEDKEEAQEDWMEDRRQLRDKRLSSLPWW